MRYAACLIIGYNEASLLLASARVVVAFSFIQVFDCFERLVSKEEKYRVRLLKVKIW